MVFLALRLADWLHCFGDKKSGYEFDKTIDDTEHNDSDLSVGFLQLVSNCTSKVHQLFSN
jgi:hypothetical protein